MQISVCGYVNQDPNVVFVSNMHFRCLRILFDETQSFWHCVIPESTIKTPHCYKTQGRNCYITYKKGMFKYYLWNSSFVKTHFWNYDSASIPIFVIMLFYHNVWTIKHSAECQAITLINGDILQNSKLNQDKRQLVLENIDSLVLDILITVSFLGFVFSCSDEFRIP